MARTTIPKTISLDPATHAKGKRQAKRRGFANSYSAYVSHLILRDDEQIRHEEAARLHSLGNGKASA